MRVSIHQPDLLPYSGFWFKMSTSDLFILSVHDQFQKHGYQRRVLMRDAWCSHQLVGKPALVPINAIDVAPGWQRRITDVIRGRYAGAKHFQTRGAELVERILEADGARLDEVNIAMIEIVRDMLGITTPLVVTAPPAGAGTARLIEQVSSVKGSSYVAGPGGRTYMGEDAEARFADAGISLEWSNHQPSTGDSIVTVLMDYDEPMEIVAKAAVTL